ncbi:inositol hexakisphosphate and diphosphoinositol-pentakisphosphate kinase isoform X2 [Anthonomus grandis grandis]|uniref:inositol hexakisphosphate and diphosphoinositol-pentakisphosphate kinase isoform X2 n=1 Tax=Anthonomus grandis grandis TaxID=2921223 RepID=UPI0021656318|nr:inositol hexakisphosphate and diphosphoinositol-pentakisphosphate kinase isoform X2 [Anthonomus grandis grandis]
MDWSHFKDWWRLKKWRKYRRASDVDATSSDSLCYCDDCFDEFNGDLELCDPNNANLDPEDMEDGGKVVIVGVCAMEKKTQSKPMKEILTRLQEFEYIKVIVFPEEVILHKPVEEWPVCDCLIAFQSKGFALEKAIQYAQLHNPYVINNLHKQFDIMDRRKVYATLEAEGIEIPRYAVLDRDSPNPKDHELVESEDHVEVNGVVFNKPFVEKPVSAEDHNIYIYYPTSAGGGSQRLFRKIGSRSSVYSPESRVRKTGSFIYEDFMPTDGTDVKVYTVGPDYAHAEARKSPALDGKVERDREGKEIRYPVILSNAEKLISRKVCLAFKQAVCGFDLLRANGKSFVCDVNGFSFVKNSNKYYDDSAKILGNMILRELAPTLHIPWSVPFQLDDPPIVPTTFGKMMELRCVTAVIRHGDRTPKQKMKVEVRHPKFFEIFDKYDGFKHGHVKLKRPKQLQEILDIARSLLAEIQQHEADPEIEEKQGKLEQLKAVLEMYGHFSGINRKVQMKYQPKGRPRGSSSDDDKPAEPSLVLILKWGGELTPAGRIQAEELGRIFRCMYPGGQGRHLAGEYAGAQGLGLLRLHSTFRHDLKIYASDEGRVQMTAAAFAKGLLALEGELTPILVQMVKSANTNGLLDNDCDSSKFQNMCKARLHELMKADREFTPVDREKINPCNSVSINEAMDFVKNPYKCCKHVHELIKSLMEIVQVKKEDGKTKEAILYHGESWDLMYRRWGKIEKDFYTKNKTFDISKIPDIYDCIKYDLQHNQHTIQFEQAEELYIYAKYLADIVIPQEYGLTAQEKLTISQGICTPLLKKIKADLQRNIEEPGEETVNRLNPRYSHGVSSPGRHVRTRLYFTSESHIHSLITVLRHGGLLDMVKDEQWRRAMEYVSMVSELNYMSQIVIMLYEDPTKDPCSEERFHIELHFSPGVNCCVQKNLPPGPGFRPHSRNESAASKNSTPNSSTTPTPEDKSHPMVTEAKISVIEEEKVLVGNPVITETTPNSSPDNSADNSPHYTYTRITKFIKSSAPIPIGNAHTVCGHEALHLAKCLTEELANQATQSSGRSLGNRTVSPDQEPRARSYDHKSPQKGKAENFHQSLDAVNNAASLDDTDVSLTPTNTPVSPPIDIPTVNPLDARMIRESNYKHEPVVRNLSPISGSLDFESCSDSPLAFTHSPNELPLTEVNLALFTSGLHSCKTSSTNELPLSDIKFKSRSCRALRDDGTDSPKDNTSLDANYDFDIKELDNTKKLIHHRSFSDPNILGNEWINSSEKSFLLQKYNESLDRDHDPNRLSPPECFPPAVPPNCFYPPERATLCVPRRGPPNLLAFFSSRRSLSHPANPPRVIDPCVSYYTECGGGSGGGGGAQSIKRHRHSIAGQMSYFKVLGCYGGMMPGMKKLIGGGSTNSLFSTAVISGSSSAPNLRDMIPSTASASAIEGFGGVPPIRPLETLHNALSLKQIDNFLCRMTTAQLYRTPSSTPPKYPSTPLPTPTGSCIVDYGNIVGKTETLKLQSPNNSAGWSGPPSFISSSGPSSPLDTNSKESSEMSSSIMSADGLNIDELAKIFPTAPGLDNDLESVGMTLGAFDKEFSGSIEFCEYYTNLQRQAASGDLTPISYGSEVDFNTNDATAGSSSALDFDFTITEDIDKEMIDNNETLTSETSRTLVNNCNALRSALAESTSATPFAISSSTGNVSVCSNDFKEGTRRMKPISNIKRAQSLYSRKSDVDTIDIRHLIKDFSQFDKDTSSSNPNVNNTSVGCLKWSTSKEKFFDINKDSKTDNVDVGKNLNTGSIKKVEKDRELITKLNSGTGFVKEEDSVEAPKIARISRSFHGNTTNRSLLDIAGVPRRASDVPLGKDNLRPELGGKMRTNEPKRPLLVTQLSQPCGESAKLSGNCSRKTSLTTELVSKNPRFTTIKVDEAEHAASVGISRSTMSESTYQPDSIKENITEEVDR